MKHFKSLQGVSKEILHWTGLWKMQYHQSEGTALSQDQTSMYYLATHFIQKRYRATFLLGSLVYRVSLRYKVNLSKTFWTSLKGQMKPLAKKLLKPDSFYHSASIQKPPSGKDTSYNWWRSSCHRGWEPWLIMCHLIYWNIFVSMIEYIRLLI